MSRTWILIVCQIGDLRADLEMTAQTAMPPRPKNFTTFDTLDQGARKFDDVWRGHFEL